MITCVYFNHRYWLRSRCLLQSRVLTLITCFYFDHAYLLQSRVLTSIMRVNFQIVSLLQSRVWSSITLVYFNHVYWLRSRLFTSITGIDYNLGYILQTLVKNITYLTPMVTINSVVKPVINNVELNSRALNSLSFEAQTTSATSRDTTSWWAMDMIACWNLTSIHCNSKYSRTISGTYKWPYIVSNVT